MKISFFFALCSQMASRLVLIQIYNSFSSELFKTTPAVSSFKLPLTSQSILEGFISKMITVT